MVKEAPVPVEDRWIRGLVAEGMGGRVEAGRPILPTRRFLVEVPNGVNVTLETQVEARGWVPTRSLEVAPRLERGDDGGIEVQTVPAVWESNEPWATLEFVGWFRDRRVACVRIDPVKVSGPSGGADVAQVLKVSLTFNAAEGIQDSPTVKPEVAGPFRRIQEQTIVNLGAYASTNGPGNSGGSPSGSPGAGGTPRPNLPTHNPPVHTGPPPSQHPGHKVPYRPAKPALAPLPEWTLKIEVNQAGLYIIGAEQIAAAGIDLTYVDPARLALYNLGELRPIHVEGVADGILGPGDRIYFYGEPTTGPYTRVNAYYLTHLPALSGPAARMNVLDGTPNPSIPPEQRYRAVARAEVNVVYWQQLPNGAGKDHWFWMKTLAPSSNGFTVNVPFPVVTGAEIVNVRAALHGYTDTVQNPDHHTRILLNGVLVGDSYWNGITPKLHDHTVTSLVLTEGPNTVTVEQVNDTGAIVDGIYTDYVEIEYERSFFQLNNELTFSVDSGPVRSYLTRNFTDGDIHAFDITDPARPEVILSGHVLGTGALKSLLMTPALGSAPGAKRRYHVSAMGGTKAPLSIAAPLPPLEPGAGADYILITAPEFESAIAPLAAHRESQGLRVKTITTRQVYDGYGFGVEGPAAIQRFLKIAFETWPSPAPSHVVLVGDATMDPLDNLWTGTKNYVPCLLRQILTDGEVPSDNLYACVVGEDPLPDLFVSRISARTPLEVSNAIQKIMGRDVSPPTGDWKTRVTHFCDKGGNFTYTLDALAQAQVPMGYSVTAIYADNYASTAAMRAATLAALSEGSVLATYLGHGAPGNWSTYLTIADVPNLTNGLRAPFVVVLNCLNGYFASPTTPQCLGEALSLAPQGGGAAVWASAGLGFLSQVTAISNHLYAKLFSGMTVGEATTAAKLDAFLLSGVIEDNFWQYVLFGDSATLGLVP